MTSRKILAFAAVSALSILPALAILPAQALAQAAAGPASTPAAVQAGAYKLETNHARIVWQVSHLGFSEWFGDFSGATGTATFDPKSKAGAGDAVSISIPVDSVTTTNAKLDGELKSPAWFDAAQFPVIAFKSTKVTTTGLATADVTGDLTFHGVTKPVTLKVKFRASGVNPLTKRFTVGFDATTEIKRSDFGVKTYVPLVGDDVQITISAPFEKAG
ncbi:MAG: YceI family protein [Caulobacteraceae bacterium]